ncbi:RNA polymerase sigma factor SigJ [Primorskyibacter sp. S187A]|uniref:RNA polymerase sigma factor SigJ n=1 Tax=Primorskyibacter sp. S187A TaxID=3415130 RepID=UPI003C7C2E68
MREQTEIFEEQRPRLTGIAYRMLGSVSDAQDVVQDTYLRWVTYDGPAIDAPAAWLSRVCTNRCLDRLKSAHKTRVDYVGPWIPDQIQTEYVASAEEQVEIASSLTTAFLLLLERLTPKERAAYLLHDIFGMPFDEVAASLDLNTANCRKLAARARRFVTQSHVRHIPNEQRQAELMEAFRSALATGDTGGLVHVLHAETTLRADSDGKAAAIRRVIEGRGDVCRFVAGVLSPAWRGMRLSIKKINGLLGLVVEDGAIPFASVTFAYDAEGCVRDFFILRHPDKLSQLGETLSTAAGGGALWFH